MKAKINPAHYTFAVSSIKVKETTLLLPRDMEALIALPSLQECFIFLADRGWQVPPQEKDPNKILKLHIQDAWHFLQEISPDPTIWQSFLVQTDFHNLKAAIKSKLDNLPLDSYFLEPCSILSGDMVKAIQEKQFSILPLYIKDIALTAYDSFIRSGDGQILDTMLDKTALEVMQKKAALTGIGLLIKQIELQIVMANLKIAFRGCRAQKNLDFFKQALVPCQTLDTNNLAIQASRNLESLLQFLDTTLYNQECAFLKSSPWEFEKSFDDLTTSFLENVKYKFFGPEPLIAYWLYKQAEIKNLRIILAAKESNLGSEKTKERLRRLYV